MPNLRLTVAFSDYDHVRDLWDGTVKVDGAEVARLDMPVEEIFHRFTLFREWDVSEFSLGRFVSLRASGDESMVAIPVFPSRVFRHSAFYVRNDSDLTDLAQLRGRRIGIPEWAQTAVIYARGLLVDQYNVQVNDVDWVQAGVDRPGRRDNVPVHVPEGARLTRVPDRTLVDMLLAGDLDTIITAHAPLTYERGEGRIRRLLPDPQATEEAYWRTTGIFPIMHVVVIRRDVLDAHPWLAMNLYKAFNEARRNSLERLFTVTASRLPIPWGHDYASRWTELFGGEYWPYGLEPNRPTLEAFLRWAFEHGVCERRLSPDELFAPSVLNQYVT